MNRVESYCECSMPNRVKFCVMYCGKPRHPSAGIAKDTDKELNRVDKLLREAMEECQKDDTPDFEIKQPQTLFGYPIVWVDHLEEESIEDKIRREYQTKVDDDES